MDGLLLTIGDQIHENGVLIGCARHEARLAVILQHDGDLIGLLSGEIQLGLELLEYGVAVGFTGWWRRRNTVEPVVKPKSHAQHSGSGAGQKHQ